MIGTRPDLSLEQININETEKEANKVLSLCTRVEVVDEKGRSYVNWNNKNKVEISIQDSGRTLKIFINKENK